MYSYSVCPYMILESIPVIHERKRVRFGWTPLPESPMPRIAKGKNGPQPSGEIPRGITGDL